MNEPASAPDPLVGRTLRAYEIQELIGISRWGKVYRAFQTTMGRTVAVRVLSPGIAALPGKTELFLEETRAEASLMHPHLVTVYEAGQSDGIYFCAMEYMDGPPLGRFLRKGEEVDEHHLLQAIAGVARALDFLWQRNSPHQPPLDRNVLTTTDGTVKLINVAPVDMPASASPREDVVNIAVMVATLTNEIGTVSKAVSGFVEGMLGAEGRQQFTSLSEVANTAEALDREMSSPVGVAKSGDVRIVPKSDRLLRVIVMVLIAMAVVAFVTWLWSRGHPAR
ncbi:MAG: protein kinase [Verrucomicrobiia bacterium]|jgi:serine/threonine-protein kinase